MKHSNNAWDTKIFTDFETTSDVSVSAMEKLDNLNPKISLACHVGIR
jgi:hypothetical protein